jgi:AcrR family transcriptional regulator
MAPDARRQEILDVARHLFTERQYPSVSMEEIARAAGVRRGLVNHYFGSKRDLYLAVVRDLIAQFDRAFPLPASDGPTEEIVAEHVDQWLKVVEQEAGAWLAMVAAEGFGRDHDVEQLVEQAREASVTEMIRVLRVDDTDEMRVVLRSYSGLADSATREWLGHRSINRDQLCALLATALLNMVRDVAPAVRAAG